MLKNIIHGVAHSSWHMADSARSSYNPAGGPNTLWANRAVQEGLRGDGSTSISTNSYLDIDFLSNGFKVRAESSYETNAGDTSYIYIAFAEQPYEFATGR